MSLQWTRLPFTFDPALLRADLASIPAEIWKAHFNKTDYEGRWSSVSLRSVSGAANDITPRGDAEQFQDTPLMQQCPHLRAAVEAFQIPLKAVRLLKLHAGSRVREHQDRDLGLEDGELRIHVPVVTNEQVEFVVANRRLRLRAGESWYIDFSQPHRIRNHSDEDRVHLVIDGRVNEWATALLQQSARELVTESTEPDDVRAFREFTERVYDDAALRDRLLLATTREELFDAVHREAKQLGYTLDTELIENTYQYAVQGWLMRGATL